MFWILSQPTQVKYLAHVLAQWSFENMSPVFISEALQLWLISGKDHLDQTSLQILPGRRVRANSPRTFSKSSLLLRWEWPRTPTDQNAKPQTNHTPYDKQHCLINNIAYMHLVLGNLIIYFRRFCRIGKKLTKIICSWTVFMVLYIVIFVSILTKKLFIPKLNMVPLCPAMR